MITASIFSSRVYVKRASDENSIAVSLAAEAVTSIRIIKALGAEDRLAGKYDKYLKESARWSTKSKVLMAVMIGMALYLTNVQL